MNTKRSHNSEFERPRGTTVLCFSSAYAQLQKVVDKNVGSVIRINYGEAG